MAQQNDISVLLENDNDSSAGSLFSGDETPDALPTSSPVRLPPMDNTNNVNTSFTFCYTTVTQCLLIYSMFQGVCQGRECSKRGRGLDSESATKQMKRPKNALITLGDEDSSSAGSLFSAASDEEDELAIETKPLSLLANFLVSDSINIHLPMFLTSIMSYV